MVLGPLTVEAQQAHVPITGPVQQAVLAFLILRHNRNTPMSHIIDAVWDDHPPATAKTQVQSQISRLRRVFARLGEPQAIKTAAGGYGLFVTPSTIDAVVFEDLINDGLAAAAQERTHDAQAVLRTALRLWHGHPLGGMDTRFARAEAARLEELRLRAIEQRLLLDLRAGRGGEVISELTALTAAHPMNESLLRHLVLALYRSGRRADAMAAYERGARLLREELGLDPGPELARLHVSILRAESRQPRLTPAGHLNMPKRFTVAWKPPR